ncbi:hypothetical protein [Phenylobacterium aquaticum]|uniref:hypothetical protein n=1 Tax=Phenylobacterium aquaticum TaxID=1763816 RepID=UPI001F5D5CAF|nr:hypothetical protein [Phenylobacterium aquaticum]MCI3133391.1 hypothetical protein [Phenylobacterium aquaticum]
MAITELDERRFNALAGYIRQPHILMAVQEYDWLATKSERVLGILTWDRVDYDFGWIALARDETLRYRAVAVQSSLPSTEAARRDLTAAMERLEAEADESFHQGDVVTPPVDFFAPLVPPERWHPNFRLLVDHPRYSPARELIAAMMRYHEDADGNFIEQFQTTGFDARVWELYLYATFTELGFALQPNLQAPDFILSSMAGAFGVEATSSNPSQGLAPEVPQTLDATRAYLENYVPIKLATALKKKLNKRRPYWTIPEMRGLPFVIALQDFHAPGWMRTIVPAATEYVFGVRHWIEEGQRRIAWIGEHRYENRAEPSGFFRLPNSEHVSAVLVNPQGTLVKFNRLGFLAGFGDRRIQMVRTGLRRYDNDPVDPRPRPFSDEVHRADYRESWIEGAVVLHNPNAAVPLDPSLLPGATHEFLEPDGRIMSLLPPDPPPYMAQTIIALDDDPSVGPEDT